MTSHLDREPTVLVVTADPPLRGLIAETLDQAGWTPTQAADATTASVRVRASRYDALVLDLSLPPAEGLRVLALALAEDPQLVPIVLCADATGPDARAATARGAHDVLVPSVVASELDQALRAGLARRHRQQETAAIRAQLADRSGLEADVPPFAQVIGRSEAMQQMFSTLGLVAPLNSTVLLQGETGTGKELVAQAMHAASPRAAQRFVAFNAAAIPETLAEAELFGHARGAFTGAVASRAGRFELAHRGTLFIDEVALMPLPVQAKLLRALQEREVERVGDARPIKFDARVIAATSADLPTLVKAGEFREDLFYRLNVIRIVLPPLRHRREDIPVLVRHFAEAACRHNQLPRRTVGPEALRAMMAHDWPGNVRELENAVEHAVALSGTAEEIQAAQLPPEVRGAKTALVLPNMPIPDEGIHLRAVLSQIEHDLIRRCLEKTAGNKKHAARLLHLSRTTLIDKLNRLGQAPNAPAESKDDPLRIRPAA